MSSVWLPPLRYPALIQDLSATFPRSGAAGKGGHIPVAARHQVPSRSWYNDTVPQGAQVPVLQLPALAKNKTMENQEVKNALISFKSLKSEARRCHRPPCFQGPSPSSPLLPLPPAQDHGLTANVPLDNSLVPFVLLVT